MKIMDYIKVYKSQLDTIRPLWLGKAYKVLAVLVIALFFVMLLLPVCARAQSHGNHVMLQIGASYPNGLEGTVAYEHETEYHNSWEYFASYYIKYDDDPGVGHITNESFWHNYNTWNVGIAYKPCVSRGRNHHGNALVGISGGSDLDHAIGMAHLGYEHTYNLYNGWSLYLKVREDVGIRLKDTFRTGVYIGVKVPL